MMHSDNNDVDHAKSDADTLIVRHVLQSATSCETVLIGDDTDLLTLILCHTRDDQHNMFFSSYGGKIWDIKKTRQLLGNELYNSILFYTAFPDVIQHFNHFPLGKAVHFQS